MGIGRLGIRKRIVKMKWKYLLQTQTRINTEAITAEKERISCWTEKKEGEKMSVNGSRL